MFRPIYTPRTRAREYCDLAVNIYDSCPHGCIYCYARDMAKRFGKPWGDTVNARPDIAEAVRVQLAGPKYYGMGLKIMLCFTCDPYPVGCDTTATRDVIRAIKESGNHVQILTKGDATAQRDLDLLDSNDSFGVTLTGGYDLRWEPDASSDRCRIGNLFAAYNAGIPTWVSCEPVVSPSDVITYIKGMDFVDLWRIGKLNYRKTNIDWKRFGHDVEALCKLLGRNYYIKEDLRKEMEFQSTPPCGGRLDALENAEARAMKKESPNGNL